MHTVLYIEDEADLQELVAFNLSKHDYTVHVADNANDALILLDDLPVDLVLLDLMLPGLRGMQFLSIMKSNPKLADIPVMVVSAKNAEHDIVSALESGAEDYLTKPFSMRILLAKIPLVMRRGKTEQDETIKYAGITIDLATYQVFVDGGQITLTNKEYELLSVLLKAPKRVFTRNQLLDQIWGYDSEVYTRTVDAHISSLRKKLGDRGKIIKAIPKIGYRVEE